MKKPKSKLEKAKERFYWDWEMKVKTLGIFRNERLWHKFCCQLNNLIRLAREEGRKGK
jgi:3'-phosphoadenosine 5'-phosphosulfate sulfotransferase